MSIFDGPAPDAKKRVPNSRDDGQPLYAGGITAKPAPLGCVNSYSSANVYCASLVGPGASLESGSANVYTRSVNAALYASGSGTPQQPWCGSRRKLSVTHIGPCMLHGGAEQHLRSLMAFLDPRRVAIERCIVTQANQCDPDVVKQLGIPVVVGGQEAVRQAARTSDVLLYWGVALDSWLDGCRPPLCVYLAHGESHWTRQLLRDSARVTDHTIAVSQRAQQAVCEGYPSTIIHNGVDTARLASTRSRRDVRAKLGYHDDDFVLGIVARYSPEKRMELLIETVARLPANFKMLAVGCGPRLEQLLRLANEQIPNRYAFVEAHTYLGDYYQAMDAYCMTSEHEGFGLVVLEAMFHGLPVIATCVGAVPELIQHARSGLIVPDDPSAFCEAAHELRSRPMWARAIGGEALAYAQQHGHASQMAEQYAALLEQLWSDKFARQ